MMMKHIQWLMRVVLASLRFRTGRSLLLLAVIAMSSSLAVSLGMVTVSMERRISDEVRKYGANLLLLPESARMDLGSGALAFGTLAEPAWLDATAVELALAGQGARIRDHSLHLREPLLFGKVELPVEGVRFDEIRRMLPWWEPAGRWPIGSDEVVIGADLARRLSLKPGDRMELAGSAGSTAALTVAGVVRTGGEEDRLLFLDLSRLQTLSGLEGRVSLVRVLADTSGGGLATTAAALEAALPGATRDEIEHRGSRCWACTRSTAI